MTVAGPVRGLTVAEEQAVRAILDRGSMKAAARALGIPEGTLRSRLATARRRTGLPTTGHLLYWLDRAA